MDERILQARVGIMVISTMLLTAIMIVLLGNFSNPFQRGKTVYVRFASAPGVIDGTPVRRSGILIGRVQHVDLIKGSSDVRVTIGLNAGREVYDNEVCRVTTTFLGDATLEFVPGPRIVKESRPVESGAELNGAVQPNPFEAIANIEGDTQQTLRSVGQASEQVSRLAENMNKLFEGGKPGQLERVLEKTELAMESFNRAAANIDDIVGDEKVRADLKASLAGLPQLLKDTRQTVVGMQSAVTRADRNLANLEQFTAPLGDHGGEIVSKLDSSITQLDQFMRQMATFSEGINRHEGSLSKLMNDPEIYNELRSAAKNINELTQRMRPVLEDVRVFTDKIARDPGQLGVRGALKKNNPSKYPNYGNVVPPPADFHEPLPAESGQ